MPLVMSPSRDCRRCHATVGAGRGCHTTVGVLVGDGMQTWGQEEDAMRPSGKGGGCNATVRGRGRMPHELEG